MPRRDRAFGLWWLVYLALYRSFVFLPFFAPFFHFIYKKIKTNNFEHNEIIEIKENIYQLIIITSVLLDNSIIKLLFTNISEIENKNKQLENNQGDYEIEFDNRSYSFRLVKGIKVKNNLEKIDTYIEEATNMLEYADVKKVKPW